MDKSRVAIAIFTVIFAVVFLILGIWALTASLIGLGLTSFALTLVVSIIIYHDYKFFFKK